MIRSDYSSTIENEKSQIPLHFTHLSKSIFMANKETVVKWSVHPISSVLLNHTIIFQEFVLIISSSSARDEGRREERDDRRDGRDQDRQEAPEKSWK